MADDVTILDSASVVNTMRATDNAGVKSAHHVIETLENGVPTPVSAAAPLPVDGPLTDTELRATPVPVSGTISTGLTQPLTDDELRASDVSVSVNELPEGLVDSFGHMITGTVNNQVDIQFYRDTVANLTTVTTANGGAASATNGMATWSTTTAANSSSKSVSPTTTYYTANAEIYAVFTAAFTGTGSGTSYQRIGLDSASNESLYIGDEGGTFGFTKRRGGTPVQVAKSSWNGDKLTGAVDSKFTRAGVPEAIDLTKLNVWKISFGWVGSAPIKLDVLSPDGRWVRCHTILQPNTEAVPSLATADLNVFAHVNNGNSGAALSILSNCWCAGTTQALAKINSTLTSNSLARLSRSVIVGETTGGGGGYVNVKVSPSGAISTAASCTLDAETTKVIGTVNIAAGQSIAATQSGTWNITNISGTVSLPTGAATAANQTTELASLSSIDGKLASLGQKVMTGSVPVVIASNQSAVTVTASNLSTNIAQLNGGTTSTANPNGCSNRSLGVFISTAPTQTDQSNTAYSGAGRVNGTIVASNTGAGAVISAEINVSSLTLGTATAVIFVLQESTGGTNFTDIWHSEPVTATGIVRVPAIPVAGRRRWCAHSVGGTSTTVTTTITTLELPPGSYVIQRQYREVYAASNAYATVINSATQTATTFGASTSLTATTQATSACVMEGCKAITAYLTLAGGPTVSVQPVISLEVSNDLTNWYTTTATITAAGNGSYSATVANVACRYARLRVTTAASYSAGSYTISAVGINGVN